MTSNPSGYGPADRPDPAAPTAAQTTTEHTTVIPPSWDAPGGSTPPGSPPSPAPRRRSRAGAAALLAAALVAGGAGGFAGAAAYDAVDDDTTSATGTSTVARSEEGSSTSLNRGSSSGSTDATDATAPEGSPEAVAARVLPSVVKIDVVSSGGAGSGSGVILSEDGDILTNNHVVDVAADGGQLTVSFDDGSTAPATVVGTDPVTDLAVIRAQDVSGLTAAELGDSDALDVGEGVVAIGSPFGLDATVTSGIVSSLNRPVTVGGSDEEATVYPAVQTDAAINPGNSGGPLVNLAGQVVGINSSIRTASAGLGSEGGSIGLGFAIPLTNVLPIVEQLRNEETPTHAQLGVTAANAGAQGGSEGGLEGDDLGGDGQDGVDGGLVTGARIASVNEGSAAEAAGLRASDVVTRVDDHAITGVESLVATIRGYRPGDEVELTVSRSGESVTLTATLDSDEEQ